MRTRRSPRNQERLFKYLFKGKDIPKLKPKRKLGAMGIYEELIKAGVPIDHHESDLYALKNEVSIPIIERYKFRSNVTTFKNQIDGKIWYDIPFAYVPAWNI